MITMEDEYKIPIDEEAAPLGWGQSLLVVAMTEVQ
jgi:hypothetical protein